MSMRLGNSDSMLTDLTQLLALPSVHLHLLLQFHHFLIPQVLLHFIVLLRLVLQQLSQVIHLFAQLQDRVGPVLDDILARRPLHQLVLEVAGLGVHVDLVVKETVVHCHG